MTPVAVQANSQAGIGRSARPTIPWADAEAGASSEASSAARHANRNRGRARRARILSS